MAILTENDYISATKQVLEFTRTATRTSANNGAYCSVIDLAGHPGAGVLAVGNTTTGVVPTDATPGYPAITNFAGGATGYLTRAAWTSINVGRMVLYDRLWHAGAIAQAAGVTTHAASGDPSPYSSRVPDLDYSVCELWVECVVASTGSPNVVITYTNEAGVTGKTTPSLAISSILGRMTRIPLAAGDKGVLKVESSNFTGAGTGTFNVVVMRFLGDFRVVGANIGHSADLFNTGMPKVFENSALMIVHSPDATTAGSFEFRAEIASK